MREPAEVRPVQPPVLEVFGEVPPGVYHQLEEGTELGYREGWDMRTICREVYHRARSFGYAATIAVRRVEDEAAQEGRLRLQVRLTPTALQRGRFRFRTGA
ncbi:MAG: hypothetical protein D6746_12410 [Bacteroidetes bacterium]|nr:MAG: hypothetical protein D6746_12410 [Bacteroidota bacterium]GIV58377.1 MAG: hypothetical protein KatS3mg042_1290 [Rhodothermaceae bacterium]